jgi:hypothetical protein
MPWTIYNEGLFTFAQSNMAAADLRLAVLAGAVVPAGALDPDLNTLADLLAVPGVVEAAAAGYSRADLSGLALTQDDTNDEAVLAWNAPTWPTVAAGETWRAAVLYVEGATNALRMLVGIDVFDTPLATNGGPRSYTGGTVHLTPPSGPQGIQGIPGPAGGIASAAVMAVDPAFTSRYTSPIGPSMTLYEAKAEPFKRVQFQSGSTLYATSQNATGNVYKSTDNGATWTTLAGTLGFDCQAMHQIVGTGTLIAVAKNPTATVKRSTDDGATWTTPTTLNFAPLGDQGIISTPSGAVMIAEYANTADTVYRIMRSTNDGVTWGAVISSSGVGGEGHWHSITYDAVAAKYVTIMDFVTPKVYSSADEGATWQLVGTSTQVFHPNFVSPMFFANHIAWGVDNEGGGRIYRLPRADFYAGTWGAPELVAQLDDMEFYETFPIRPDTWLVTAATEAIDGAPAGAGSYATQTFLVSADGALVSGGLSHATSSATTNALLGQRSLLPGYPYTNPDQKGRSWINLSTAGLPMSVAAVPYSVGEAPPMAHTSSAFPADMVLQNNVCIDARGTNGTAYQILTMNNANRVSLRNSQASPMPEVMLYDGATSVIAFLFGGVVAFQVTATKVDLAGREFLFNGVGLPSWQAGTGAPEGVKFGRPGCYYSRSDGGAGTSLYVKESGSNTNTGWVAYAPPSQHTLLSKAISYSLLPADDFVVFTGASLTATLPTAVGATGHTYRIKNTNASALTIATTAAQTIDGAAPGTVAQWAKLVVTSDGANWLTI